MCVGDAECRADDIDRGHDVANVAFNGRDDVVHLRLVVLVDGKTALRAGQRRAPGADPFEPAKQPFWFIDDALRN
jgi:hypothetical protein